MTAAGAADLRYLDVPIEAVELTPFGSRIQGMDLPFELKMWVADCGHVLEEAWRQCDRADWMVRLLVAANFDAKRVTLLAITVAEDVLPLVQGSVAQLRNAMVCARDWCRGMTPLAQVQLAIRQAHMGNSQTQTFPFYAVASACHSCVHQGDAANAVYAAAEAQANFGDVQRGESVNQAIARHLARYADMVRAAVPASDLGQAMGL